MAGGGSFRPNSSAHLSYTTAIQVSSAVRTETNSVKATPASPFCDSPATCFALAPSDPPPKARRFCRLCCSALGTEAIDFRLAIHRATWAAHLWHQIIQRERNRYQDEPYPQRQKDRTDQSDGHQRKYSLQSSFPPSTYVLDETRAHYFIRGTRDRRNGIHMLPA